MSLSDYDTSVEKIAALKAATLDPALTIYLTPYVEVTLTESIFPITNQYILNGSEYHRLKHDETNTIPAMLHSGDVIQNESGSVMYIKDSDIIYSDPITTYQNRIAAIMQSHIQISNEITVGLNGAIMKHIGYNGDLYIDDIWFFSEDTDGTIPHLLPLKSGDVVRSQISSTVFAYINLPADW